MTATPASSMTAMTHSRIAGSMALCDAIMAAAYRGARSVAAAPQRMVRTAWRMVFPPFRESQRPQTTTIVPA
jgi:hypothetical protein